MSQKAANVDYRATTSKKCANCGLRNFGDVRECKRCKSDLSQALMVGGNHLPDKAKQPGWSKSTIAVICAAGLALVLCLVSFYANQGASITEASVGTVGLAKAPVPQANQAQGDTQQNPSQESPQSLVAPGEVLEELKRFQSAAGGTIGYEEYDAKLTQLNTLVGEAVPAFESANHAFGVEVEAAVRDYIAAGKWWKTTIRYSTFSDADRMERTQAIWNSAKIHVENAEKELVR